MKNLQRKYIFTPGPVRMSEEILKLGSIQTPYFRNKEFSKIILECEENLLEIVNAPKNSRVIFLTASGTAGMEVMVQNFIGKKNKALVINGGNFGQRFVEICKFHNKNYVEYKVENTNLSNEKELEKFKDIDTLFINGHETSIGLLYNLKNIGKFCAKNKVLNIVDAISMFVTDELDMQKMEIDALILSSQKGLALPPGISMLVLTPKAIERVEPSKAYYFNLKSYLTDGKRGQTPFTPAVTILLQLHYRLKQIKKDGIESEIKKAKEISKYFREQIKDLPVNFYSNYMPNAMTSLSPSNGQKATEIVKVLSENYDIIVAPNGGELREKIFRVSHMGDMTKEYTDVLINALKKIFTGGVK